MMDKRKLVRRQLEKGKFKKHFYVVTGSHKSGIFTSWSEASKYVKGISGAACDGHKTLEKAKFFAVVATQIQFNIWLEMM